MRRRDFDNDYDHELYVYPTQDDCGEDDQLLSDLCLEYDADVSSLGYMEPEEFEQFLADRDLNLTHEQIQLISQVIGDPHDHNRIYRDAFHHFCSNTGTLEKAVHPEREKQLRLFGYACCICTLFLSWIPYFLCFYLPKRRFRSEVGRILAERAASYVHLQEAPSSYGAVNDSSYSDKAKKKNITINQMFTPSSATTCASSLSSANFSQSPNTSTHSTNTSLESQRSNNTISPVGRNSDLDNSLHDSSIDEQNNVNAITGYAASIYHSPPNRYYAPSSGNAGAGGAQYDRLYQGSGGGDFDNSNYHNSTTAVGRGYRAEPYNSGLGSSQSFGNGVYNGGYSSGDEERLY